ncbi:MAG TPA: PAS domain S-box protein [Candidatus Acidoferrum sp.]|nr:PAS domain S-box protein [Candidatus Acidoferrum sp.]
MSALPVGVVLLLLQDADDLGSFRIVDANVAAAQVSGASTEMFLGKTLADFPEILKTKIPAEMLAALQTGRARNLGELQYSDDRIRHGIYSLRIFPLSRSLVGAVIENVTDRKMAEQALRESEERLRLLVQGVKEYAIFHLDATGHVASWNAGAQRLKGYSAKEIVGKHFSIFYPGEDVKAGKPLRVLVEAAEKGQYEEDGWRIRKDGSRFWANVVITALRDSRGTLQGFSKLTRDVSERREKLEALKKAKEELERRIEQRAAALTKVNQELRLEIGERKRAEEQLRASLDKLRALGARLQTVREEERKHVAREIHDQLGQTCTAIKMDLALISHRTAKPQAKLRKKIRATIQLVDEMILTLRRIASELRPRTLDDLGLPSALEWQAQDFERRTGIRCSLSLPAQTLPLDSEQSTGIFRIFQESLTNVARHAHATSVEARLETRGGQASLQIRDNGRGFDVENAQEGGSLGLVGMQERAYLLNGELKIESDPRTGTILTLRIPL